MKTTCPQRPPILGLKEVFCFQILLYSLTSTLFPVYLYTCSNYHWSLKQVMHYKGSETGIVSGVAWDPEQAGRLYVTTRHGHLYQYEWAWSTYRSLGLSPSDPANVFVIDGCKCRENFLFSVEQIQF